MQTSRESNPNFERRGGRVREGQPRIGGQSRHGQIVEFTPSRPGRYYLARITDAGSVPCSTTNPDVPAGGGGHVTGAPTLFTTRLCGLAVWHFARLDTQSRPLRAQFRCRYRPTCWPVRHGMERQRTHALFTLPRPVAGNLGRTSELGSAAHRPSLCRRVHRQLFIPVTHS